MTKSEALDALVAESQAMGAYDAPEVSRAAPAPLSIEDVYTLMGHAAVLRGQGQTDMPTYFFDLAERMALSLGLTHEAARVAEVAKKELAPRAP